MTEPITAEQLAEWRAKLEGANPLVLLTKNELRALLDEVERLRAVMADSLTIEPCHITGMHAPNHHTDYLCAEQMREAWMRLVMAMGLVPESEAGEDVNTYNRRKLRTLHQQLPRRNHDESCYWCEKNGDGWHEVQP